MDYLKSFPRPLNDSGRGVHWAPNQYLWGKKEWPFWRDEIQAMRLNWVKILDDGSGSVFGLIQRLVDIMVMPIVRIYREQPNPGAIKDFDFIKRCVEAGAMYFETNNEPDLDLEWKNRQRPSNWLDIVVDNFIYEASKIRDLGGYLLFPAFGPGGRGNPFKMIVDRGRKDLLDGNCCLAIHNYCLGRPLDYPNDVINMYGYQLSQDEWEEAGGFEAWEMGVNEVNFHRINSKNPNASIMEDSTCFRAFEYFDTLVNEAVGHSIPIFTTEGGYNVGQRAGTTFGDDARYPKPTPEKASQFNDAMFQYIEEKAPDYYFGCMPWAIGAQRFGIGKPGFEAQGMWYTNWFGVDGELPIVQRLKDRPPSQIRANGPAPSAWKKYDWSEIEGRKFDDRFKYLNPQVRLIPVENDNEQYWRLTEAKWQDNDEDAIGYIFVRVLSVSGQTIPNIRFRIRYGDKETIIKTKDSGYGDFMMTARLGTYKVDIYEFGLQSDSLINIGLGSEIGYSMTSFFLTFMLEDGGSNMFDYKKYVDQYLENSNLDELESYGELTEANVFDKNQPVYDLIGFHHLTPDENNGKHHVWLDVRDEDGNRIDGAIINWTWEGRKPDEIAPPIIIDKPDNEIKDLAIWANQKLTLWVNGQSDILSGINTLHQDEVNENGQLGNYTGHHSFLVVWRRRKANQQPSEQPGQDCEKFNELLNDVKKTHQMLMGVCQQFEILIEEAGKW